MCPDSVVTSGGAAPAGAAADSAMSSASAGITPPAGLPHSVGTSRPFTAIVPASRSLFNRGFHVHPPAPARAMAADRLPALLDLEEPPERARASGRRAGGPSADPTNVSRQPPVGRAADSRGTPEARRRDFAGGGLQVSRPRNTPPSQTWRTFLTNHVQTLVSVDFFTVPTVTFKVLFVFVILAHHRRRVVHFNVTDAPTAQWTGQQLVEAFPWERAPRYLLRDRDGVYGVEFSSRVRGMGICDVKTAPRSP